MSNKIVNITINKLDITQLTKCHAHLNDKCNTSNYSGAYLNELRELVVTLIEAGYAGKTSVTAPDLTI